MGKPCPHIITKNPFFSWYKNVILGIVLIIFHYIQLQHPDYKRITINPEVCFGKPCIRGIRFPVSTLLGYLASGISIDELMVDFPFLEKEDIMEALAFSARAMDERMLPLKQARA